MSNRIDAYVWECVELVFIAQNDIADPFLTLELRVEFQGPDGRKLCVPGFWDGGRTWKVRFAPVSTGEWNWRSACNQAAESGLHGRTGVVHAAAWSEAELDVNPNRRGFLRVHEAGRYFEYADGTPFYWLGDTLWAAHATRCDPAEALPRYLQDRTDKKFTVIQMVVGYPTANQSVADSKSYWNYPLSLFTNEGGAPYSDRYREINPHYFHYLDQRIRLMTDRGFVPCLQAMWGHELKGMTVEAAKPYLRYLVARYGAFNVVWSLSGEFLFTWDVQGWRELGEEVDRVDPYEHPTSVHSIAPYSGSAYYHGESWYDFSLIQVGHALAFKNFMEELPRCDYHMQPPKPTIMSESWYENHPNTLTEEVGRITDKDIRFASYVPLLQGCIGQTYGAHGIWSFYDGKIDKGWNEDNRPDLWTKDLHLPGSGQMKHLREAMEKMSWWQLEPHPEWVSTVKTSSAYCAAIVQQEYIVYCTGGGEQAVPLFVMIKGSRGERYDGQWMNPRTGVWSAAKGEYAAYGYGWLWRTETPDEEDWILILKRA